MTPTVLMIQCNNAGTTYWRFYSWWEAMHRNRLARCHVLGWDKKQGGPSEWQIHIGDPSNQPKLFGMLYSAAVQADIIIWQRLETEFALTAFYAMRDQFPNKPMLTECDDDITDVAAYNPAAACLAPGSNVREIAISQFRNSDAMIVSTPYLAEIYGEYCARIHVVENSIDFVRWGKPRLKKKPGLRVGWIGATSHSEDLKLLENVLPRVLERNKEIRFIFTSNDVPNFIKNSCNPRIEYNKAWVPILRYPDHLRNLDYDIGLAPLRDNKFNRAKSNLRWLEYSSLGIPSVCSNVGHFAETIKDGYDGLLAKNDDEWVNKLLLLAEDKKFRRLVGAAAKARIQADFNIDRNCNKYLAAIQDALSRPVMPAPPLVSGVDELKDIKESDIIEAEKEDALPVGVELMPLVRQEVTQ